MIHRTVLFAMRTMKETLRDPVNLFFALAFPLLLLWMLHIIDSAIPSTGASQSLMRIDTLAPGIATFAPVFMALFAGMVLARDRASTFLTRLFASPMSAAEFLAGYTLPMLLIAMVQAVVTLLVGVVFGLSISWNMLAAVVLIIPVAFLYVGIGLLAGSLLSANAVGGVCGALLTIIAGWCSGTWLPIELLGNGFQCVCDFLPFVHASHMAQACLTNNWGSVWQNLWPVLVWAAALYLLATVIFAQVKRNK